PLERLGAAPSRRPALGLAYRPVRRRRLVVIVDVLDPRAVLGPEIHHDRIVDLPRREDRVAAPVPDVLLGAIDDAAAEGLDGFVVAPEQPDEVVEAGHVPLVRRAAEE